MYAETMPGLVRIIILILSLWMLFIYSLGGILLIFLAGTEINKELLRDQFKESFLIGLFSFLVPLIGCFLYTYYIAGWNLPTVMIAVMALSTSLAVVYSTLLVLGIILAVKFSHKVFDNPKLKGKVVEPEIKHIPLLDYYRSRRKFTTPN